LSILSLYPPTQHVLECEGQLWIDEPKFDEYETFSTLATIATKEHVEEVEETL